MAKQKTSFSGLINLAALNKEIKKAEKLYWCKDEGGFSYIISGHFAVKLPLIECYSDVFASLVSIFGGIPENGKGLEKRFNSSPAPTSINYKSFWNVENNYAVTKTGLTYDTPEASLSLLQVVGSDNWKICAIQSKYAALVSDTARAYTSGNSAKTPIVFECGEEKALILPAYIGNNEMLKRVGDAIAA